MRPVFNGLCRFDDFELDCAGRKVLRNGERIALSPKAFDVLVYLASNPGRLIPKDELMKAVWPESYVEESNLAQQISQLRKAFKDKSDLIATVPGRGYQFTAQVVPLTHPQAELPPAEPNPDVLLLQHVRERTHTVLEQRSETRHASRSLPSWVASSWMIGCAAVLLALSVIGYFGWRHFAPRPQLRKVVIADFLNLTGDSSMDAALKSAVSIGLGQTPYIQLMSDSLIRQTLARMEKPPDTPLLGDTALEICRRGDYQVLLRGHIELTDYRYQLSLEPVNCATGRSLGVFRGQANEKDTILDTLDSEMRRVRAVIGEPNASLAQFSAPLIDATTFSFEALQDYNTGTRLGNAGNSQAAKAMFEKAVAIDPKFAEGWDQLGVAWWDLGDSNKAAAMFQKAYDLSSNVTQDEKFSIRYHYDAATLGDLVAGAKNLEAYTKVYPADDWGWGALADAYVQLGDFPHALTTAEQVLRHGTYHLEMIDEVWIGALFRSNRFADAKRAIAQAQAQGRDGPHLHHMLYEMALIEQDRETQRKEAAWSKNQPEYSKMLRIEAIASADAGKLQEFESSFEKDLPLAAKDISPSFADSMLLDEALIEMEFGRMEKAASVLEKVQNKSDLDSILMDARAGNFTPAKALLRQKESRPTDTFRHYLQLPELRALAALHNHDPLSAIAALEVSRPYELARGDILEVRAQAYLTAGQADQAIAEYQKMLAHPALEDPMLPRTILAHLGLARAYALQRETAASRAEYEKLFELWKDADPGLPILDQARREYRQLDSSSGVHP
ncbi:winged helix-turn-helix domain-containing protein [Silvibacterium dinghuense]|uniref:Tetratricopeptide repeat protein n=1 Tax=Silvibacterium dinghuense TaxID=1560006 RepID=A0A4Q1S960_9BACT|nr:winged helix-turn-helix domain-containing protein [Silvibacterium dinghuense]RXS93435.1 tetratricopeptide repeat protein [Silvibacterium dinghuense]GGH05766.1 hypothetical protein GCM10011586_22470 [Silvibacterium dinghuense]